MAGQGKFEGKDSTHKVSALDGEKSPKVSSAGRPRKGTIKPDFVQNLNIVCLNCGKPLSQTVILNRKNLACNNACRKEYTQKGLEEARRLKLFLKGKTNDRKCIVCNKPCSPNYFFCSRHIHRSSYEY